jgi:serine/threonine-protein kinase
MNEFPRRFGKYLLLKPLARGGMGALYLALSGPEESAKLCVIKTVLPHLADKEYLQRFRDEAKVVVRLSHGNLVPVFDSGQVAGEIYLAMDFIEGKDLRATWNRCAKKGIAFPVDVAVHLTKELARGLHYAHTFSDIKLVHRDVSPPNVLLSYSGEVKLTDFGLAASTLKMEKTAPGIIYGKVSYMSPEQARGESPDGRTDLYAAGIILWELLTGRQLFPSVKAQGGKDAITAEELLRRVRDPEVVAPSKRASRVPPELDRIALKALAPDLKDRYQTCEELRQDLATFLAQTAPATDSVRVAGFLKDLYAEDIASERKEREELAQTAREWFTSGALPRAAVQAASPPPPPLAPATPRKTVAPAPGAPPLLALKPAAAPPAKPPGATPGPEARAERHTLVAGPTRHDKALDKRNTQAAGSGAPSDPKKSDEISVGDRASEQGTAAVVGTVIGGRYFVRRLCGEGGMGRVYEAEHTDIGKRVALKILHPAYSQTPDLVERLRREARAASKISHPNVVDVTDSGTTPDGAFFFVMEYLEGIELGELIFKEGKLALPRALHIGSQICRALQAAHQVNVIHRDLKPENVLILSRDGQKDFVKVLDFGIAKSGADGDDEEGKPKDGKAPRRLTHPGMTMGTPEYMAPEQAAGRPADPRSDIYAAGGLLYEMLTGKAPYEGKNFMEILHKKANTLPAPLATVRDDVSPELEALVMRTLSKDPAQRPQSMEELGRLLLDGGGMAYPSLMKIDLDFFASAESGGTSNHTGPVSSSPPAMQSTSALTRLRLVERKKVYLAAGGLAGLALVLGFLSLTGKHKAKPPEPVAIAVPAPAPPVATPPVATPPAPPVEPPPPPSPPVAAAEAQGGTEAQGDGDGEAAPEPDKETPRHGRGRRAPAGPTHAESKKMLKEGERLLHLEKFTEARGVFQKVAQSKRDRGRALVGLAEISFQEKKYAEAVKSAQIAAGAGGGVRARVLEGDANFRLNHFKEAAKAYEDALKLDPANPSAKSGLALANKRM